MADARTQELAAEKENAALKKLQAAAGLIKPQQAERLDWMYEQSAASLKKTDDELMNMSVADQKGKDVEDVKALNESTAGSLFLGSATKTSEDMLRKLREDPLFQIRREEHAAREAMMSNPLILARIKKKEQKQSKKQLKKASKKEKKAAKKAKKAEKKKKKTKSSSSSSSSDGDSDAPAAPDAKSRRTEAPDRAAARRADSPRVRRADPKDLSALGPSGNFINKREEHAKDVERRKDEALASRGAPRRMTEEEKQRKFDEFKADAKRHEANKDVRIASAETREKAIEESEARMRNERGQSFVQDIRKEAYLDGESSVAERMKNQRSRRQKGIIDSLEKD